MIEHVRAAREEPPKKLRQVVVTIHGANPDLTWQDKAKAVLEPHFRCESIAYDEDNGRRGVLRIVTHLRIAVVTVVLAAVACLLVIVDLWFAALAAFLSAVSLVAGIGIARVRRHTCADSIKVKISNATSLDNPPHVIAHSLGTFLVATSLSKTWDATFDRIILVGSILPRRFDWRAILKRLPDAFSEVRNETGSKDWAVRLSGFVGPFVRDIGAAGVHGFLGPLAHSKSDPLAGCDKCASTGGVVHNVPLGEFGHSTHFLGPGHARKLWLPVLWGFPPGEFNYYIRLCRNAAYSRQARLNDDLALAEGKLCSRDWTWFGASLEDFLRKDISASLENGAVALEEEDYESVVNEAIGFVPIVITDALEESKKTVDRDESVIRCLHPLLAIPRAIDKAIKVTRGS